MEATASYQDLPQLPLRAKVIKFAIDMGWILLFAALSPLFLVLLAVNWVYYQRDERGGGLPIVSSTRYGMYAQPFRFFQLRTHTRAGELTPLGEWLKKWALDEVPQIFNIALRQMSMVGPRPVVKRELDEFGDDPDFKFRFGALPGVCGIAIGTFTNTEAIAEGYKARQTLMWATLDRDYIHQWALKLELLAYKLSFKDAKRGHDPTPKPEPVADAT